MRYEDFLATKRQLETDGGFVPLWLPDFLFPFQRFLVEWALLKGRGAMFADCGMGKTPMSLVWCENIVRKTGKPVLIVAPLAVLGQTVREGEKFGVEVHRTQDGTAHAGVNITNYERLHLFNPRDFAGVACDESSILKSFEGATRATVTEFLRTIQYRLLCTATAAPNDYYELGTSSEALGYLGFMDMLGRFFKNNRNNSALNGMGNIGGMPTWRFRGHAEKPFWRWVCSWARSARKPSDLGFDDGKFILPELREVEHVVRATRPRDGFLFSVPAVGLAEEREERRRTLKERCETAARLVADTGAPAVTWAHLNDEADLLEEMIDGSVQVSGRDSDEEKEEKFTAFRDGQVRVLVTKPIIGAWGLNWQHCAHMTTFGGHSFEQYYQSVRRFWRFGQTLPVVVDHVISDGEQRVLNNLRRKAEQAEKMFTELAGNMRDELQVARDREFTQKEEVPSWL